MKPLLPLLLCLLSVSSYAQDIQHTTVGCELVEKAYLKKNGELTGHQELYLRCSIQDYFIKLCESDVSEAELRQHLNEGISVEIEIVDGEWDICTEEIEVQSRVGLYVRILKLE